MQIFCEITKNTKAHLSFAALFGQKRAFAAKMPSFGNANVKDPLIKPHFCSKLKTKTAKRCKNLSRGPGPSDSLFQDVETLIAIHFLADDGQDGLIQVFNLLEVTLLAEAPEQCGLVNLLTERLVDESVDGGAVVFVSTYQFQIHHGLYPGGIMIVMPEIHMSGDDGGKEFNHLLGGTTRKQVGVSPDGRLPQVAQRNLLFQQLMNMDKPQMTVDLLLSQFIPVVKNIRDMILSGSGSDG